MANYRDSSRYNLSCWQRLGQKNKQPNLLYFGITGPEQVGRDDVTEDPEVLVPGLTASNHQSECEEWSQEKRDGEPHKLDLYLTGYFGGIVTGLQNVLCYIN